MIAGRSRIILIVASVIAMCTLTVAVRADEPWQAARVWVTGGEQSAWVVAEGRSPGNQLPTVQMWQVGPQAPPEAAPTQNSFLQPITGRVQQSAADVAALRILFSDLTTGDYYSNRAWSPGASWKEQSTVLPLAWGADAIEPAVYAVARSDDLVAPTTSPSDDAEAVRTTAAGDALDDGFDGMMVLEMRRGRWRRIEGPIESALARRVWITGHGGKIHFFWRDGRRVLHAERSRKNWSQPAEVISCDDFLQAWVGATAEGPNLIVARGESGSPARLQLFTHRDASWADMGPIRAGSDVLEVDVERASAAIVRKQLAIVRIDQDGKVEFGLGELGQTPLVRFSELSLRGTSPAMEQQWRDSIVMAVLLGFLTIVMWLRRTEIARPVVVPPGFVLSAVWRRVFAAMLDFAPATAMTAPWWVPKFNWAMLQMAPGLTNEQMAESLAAFRIEQYVTIALCGLWCLIFEATIATTPGKLIFGCRVASADGARPSLGQCIVRNAVRSLMVAMGLPGLMITLMTIVIVSRNRQRVGDLLARTMVIEPAPPATEAPPPSDESEPE